MSELNFTCPACGQRLQCAKAYCGDVTTCPNCHAQLRVPFSHTPPEPQTMLPRAELISEAPGSQPSAGALSHAGLHATPTEMPQEITPSPAAKRDLPPKPAQAPVEVDCICPICHSELRLRDAEPSRGLRFEAEPSRKISTAAGSPGNQSPPAAAHDVQSGGLNAAMKPRLGYILSGGAAVSSPTPAKEPSADPGLPDQSFSE